MFVGALKGIAPLLVFVLIMSSVSKHQANTQTFIKPIISLYLFTTLLAATVAVLASYIFPLTISLQEVSGSQEAPKALIDVLTTILNNIVQNPLQAMIDGNYLGFYFGQL